MLGFFLALGISQLQPGHLLLVSLWVLVRSQSGQIQSGSSAVHTSRTNVLVPGVPVLARRHRSLVCIHAKSVSNTTTHHAVSNAVNRREQRQCLHLSFVNLRSVPYANRVMLIPLAMWMLMERFCNARVLQSRWPEMSPWMGTTVGSVYERAQIHIIKFCFQKAFCGPLGQALGHQSLLLTDFGTHPWSRPKLLRRCCS